MSNETHLQDSIVEPVASAEPTRLTRRRTLPSAIGEPMIWLTGGALVVCIVMIVMLISLVVINGSKSFWPRAIEQVTLDTGEVFFGIVTDQERIEETFDAEVLDRTLYQVGNRDLGQASYRWVNDESIAKIELPEHAVMLEREAWGVWFGLPESIVRSRDGQDDEFVVSGAQETLDAFDDLHVLARSNTAKVEELKANELGTINRKIERIRINLRQEEINAQREAYGLFRFGWIGWLIAGGCVLVCGGVLYRIRDMGTAFGASNARAGVLSRWLCALCGAMLLGAMLVAGPWSGHRLSEVQLDELRASGAQQEVALLEDYDRVLNEIKAIEEENQELRLIVREPTNGNFAPVSQTLSDEPMYMGQVVRLVQGNTLSTGGKFGVYFSRWWEYLSTNPREANTEGGVYPVIVGTVVLTILLTIFVTPMGVIAALYLREYAPQGFLTSLIRIAINNLAGVPSIVYGVFGLGFFCYTVGGYVDVGASDSMRLSNGSWWLIYLLTGLVLLGGVTSKVWSKPDPGKGSTGFHRMMKRCSWLAWTLAVVLVVTLIARMPYFHGLYEAKSIDGTPTFGTRGMLWASLTLAMLTLPVVIVATEEAIAAVPNSMREGSYGCGASKWQTIWRIVLPGAMPGILTGAILAMARGAGEVAPLMLVGAVKLNQDLPVSTEAPFVHADQSFMHLGFHIFDLGFQSPDSQAARPLVWTTTLLFLAIVFALNFVAIIIRSRLRAKMAGPQI